MRPALIAALPALLCPFLNAQASWSMLYPSSSPPPRYWGAMAFHEASAQMILFGGSGPAGLLGDTWSLQGSTWTQLGGTMPPARVGAAMVYDSVRDRIVLFGGTTAGSSGAMQDTWEFDGTTWSQVATPTSPPVRRSHAMAFDRERGVTVLYGGYWWNSLDDLWEYDGNTWQSIPAANAPGARHQASFCFDPVHGGVLLYGGVSSPAGSASMPRNDTWTWNGSSWLQRQPATPPMLHVGGLAVADLARERVIQTSGQQGGPFAWEWDGGNWNMLLMASPGEREFPMVGYDTDAARVVMFGGEWQNLELGDTWVYETPLPARVVAYGGGCAGSAGLPELQAAPGGLPWVGDVMGNVVRQAPGVGALFVSSFAQLAPFDLGGVGMPGCELLVSLDVVEFSVAVGGEAEWTTPIPNVAALAGVPFYQQAFPVDGAANALGFAASNGVVVTPGVR